VLAALVATVAGCEDLWLRYRMSHGAGANLFDQVTIIEAGEVKGGKLEYYTDQPQMQTCVHAVFPHFGDAPCWYVKRHTTKMLSRRERPAEPHAAGALAGVHKGRRDAAGEDTADAACGMTNASFRERAARSWT